MRTLTRLGAALVTTLLVAGCSTASPDAADAEAEPSTSPSAASDSSDEPSTEPPSDPAEGQSGSGAGGSAKRFVADVYAFDLPAGWTDRTEQFKALQSLVDGAAADTEDIADGFADNVNVVLMPVKAQLSRSQLQRQAAKELGVIAEQVTPMPPRTVAGEEAIHHTAVGSMMKLRIRFDQFIATHGDTYVTITFSHTDDVPAAQRQRVVDTVLGSWEWDPSQSA